MSYSRPPRLQQWLEDHPSEPRRSASGLDLDLVYADEDDCDRLAMPGEYPFTRGAHPSMYRGRLWTMRQYAGFGTAKQTNARFRALLDAGQSGLSVAFDLPTQIGYDPDHPMARAEVGKVGVSIASLEDMSELLDGIPLDRVSTSMTINTTAMVLLAFYVAVAEEQGVSAAKISGTIQNDILKEYAARGTYRFPTTPSLRLITDTFAWCAEHAPRFNPISISGYHMREAGCTAAQELGFTLANGIAYVEAALEAGLEIDAFASRLSFFFNCHNDFFEEIAKFRAARRMWAKIMRERFHARQEKSWRLRFHTQTAGSTLTSQQYENNVVRVTLQALAAVMGGTQSLHTNGRDEALSLPTEESARLALRTQQIIAHESGVCSVVDPLGGSPFIEALTDGLEEEALGLIESIDELGGAPKAIDSAFIQREIHASAYAAQKRIESGEDRVVGVNLFQGEEAVPEAFRVDEAAAAQQIARVEKLRRDRAAVEADAARANLDEVARGGGNLMPATLRCVKARLTVGEICATLEGVFGSYREVPVF